MVGGGVAGVSHRHAHEWGVRKACQLHSKRPLHSKRQLHSVSVTTSCEGAEGSVLGAV